MPRILVIDDSTFQRILARSALEPEDFEVLDAADGNAGLELIRNESLDCVLLDWLMPEISGRDVLQIMHDEGLNVPVIVVTGSPEDVQEECDQLGAAAVVDKPRGPGDLVDVIKAVLSAGDQS